MGHPANTDEKELLTPKEIEFLSSKKIVSIFAGANCSFAVEGNGTLYAWGEVNNIEYKLQFVIFIKNTLNILLLFVLI